MESIPSFTVDHLKLKCGVFVSCKYQIGNGVLTTFDLRMKRPYHDPVMETGSIHALEHIIATYLRNDKMWGHKIIYFGPMGCRTGFYLIMLGDLMPEDILPLLERTFDYAAEFEGDIPGATPKECGFFVDMDLESANYDAALYYNVLIDAKKENLRYPVKRERKKADEKTTAKKKPSAKKTSTKKKVDVAEKTEEKDAPKPIIAINSEQS